MNPLACSSVICFLSFANSFMCILYGLLEICGVPGSNSIRNSMSRSGGVPSESSGNTSGYT
jgi:energy-converting hydrogenase Eha subunit B